jgi:hydroxypyruvate isomerase
MTHDLPYLVNCSILFTELPLLERPRAAKAAGFDAVEFWWPFAEYNPSRQQVEEFVSAVRDAGVQLVGLNFAAGDMPAGDRGWVSWPGREEQFRANVDVAVFIGEQLGVTAFNALYGNRVEDVDPAAQDALALDNLAFAAHAASRIGAAVLVEPVSGAPRYPLRSAADVLTVIDNTHSASGTTNLRLLADLYHLSINGDDVARVIAEHTARIGHVQIADAPGRHEPGTGQLGIQQHLTALSDAGYTGWVGLEYAPSGPTELSFDWLEPARRAAPSTRRGTADATSTT